ncbi:MAG: hypothetical protein QXH26_05090 [Candidatus Hadarchaeales archaeon]
MEINIQIYYASAEKLWETGKPLPPNVQVSANVSIVSVEMGENKLILPFVTSITYNPSVAQISLKGKAIISGEKEELEKIQEGYKKHLPPPPSLLQTITNTSLIEAVILSKTVGVPPPVPLPSFSAQPQPQQKEGKEKLTYIG